MSQNTNVGTEQFESSLKPITLDELRSKGMKGATVTMDLDADAWGFAAPPPKGRYKLRVYLGSQGYQVGYSSLDPKNPKEEDVYVTAPLECKIVSDNPDYDGVRVFPRVNTRVYRGRPISQMIGLVKKSGLKIPKAELNVIQQVDLFSQMLKREPVIEADLDWRGSYQDSKGEWVNALKHFEDFPDDPNNKGMKLGMGFSTRPDGGVETGIKAQLFVDYWYDKGETTREQKSRGSGMSVSVPTNASAQVEFTPKVNGPAAPMVVSQPQEVSAEDLALLLSE